MSCHDEIPPAKKITACGIRNWNPQTKANELKFEDFLYLYAEFNLLGTYKKWTGKVPWKFNIESYSNNEVLILRKCRI